MFLEVADEPPKESNRAASNSRTKKESFLSARSKVLLLNHLRADQRRERSRNISSGCESFTLFSILRRRDIAETCFCNTIDLKIFHTMKMMTKEDIARGLGISNNKGLDVVVNYVGNTKVLPLTDAALSSRHQYGNDEKRDQKPKSDKTKTLSKMKELLRWAAAAKSEKGGKYISRKVLQFRNRAALKSVPDDGQLSNDSPKISFRWDMESCSTTSSVYSSLSKASSKRIATNQNMIMPPLNSTTPIHDHGTPAKSGSWITTDSDFVVLEL